MILFSVLGPIEDLLEAVLEWFHGMIGNWGWAIVALTLAVRVLLVPLVVRQIHSMQRLQAHAPEMKALQERYKNDKVRQREELMAFYKENNINPAASCLPLLAQLPIFFALFFVLRDFAKRPKCDGAGDAANCLEPSELRWLEFVPSVAANVSEHWSGWVLIFVYVASQVASTLFMATTMPKSQRNILLALPIVFVPFIVNFPAGLVLYWMTTNLWTVGQGLVTRGLRPKPDANAAVKRSSRTPPKVEAPAPAAAPARSGGGGNSGASQQRKVKRKKKGGSRR